MHRQRPFFLLAAGLPFPIATWAVHIAADLEAFPNWFTPPPYFPRGKFPPSAVEPMLYMHVPKAGSSFASTLLHFACRGRVPENLTFGDGDWSSELFWARQCGHFMRFAPGHMPLPMKDNILPKAVTMLREPKQRTISAWYHGLHDCEQLKQNYTKESDIPFLEFARCVQGCQINMLCGRRCGVDPIEGSEKVAMLRLEKLGFFGLTSHWDLSVCLFHAKFGGECLPSEFKNIRPGVKHSESGYLEDGLESFTPADDVLYKFAEKRFFKELEAYGVSRASCATRICPKAKHVFHLLLSDTAGDAATLAFDRGAVEAPCTDAASCDWPGRLAFDED